jgi:hypothetical protein
MLETILSCGFEGGLELGATLSTRLRGRTRHSRMRLNMAKYKACLADTNVLKIPLRFYKDTSPATTSRHRDMRSMNNCVMR